MPAASLRTLLEGLIDYAGLFPPAALPMADVHHNFDRYRRSPHAWALGRLVVPAGRLEELSAHAAASPDGPVRISALIGDDVMRDLAIIRRENELGRLVIDTVEASAPSASAVDTIATAIGNALTVYLEIPVESDPRPLVANIRQVGARAKIRTGGVVATAVPSPSHCARFISRCAEHDVAFKATAGLHHPLRGDHALDGTPDGPRATMFGFLNLFIAAAFARSGVSEASIAHLLDERDVAAFQFTDGAIAWRGHSVSLHDVAAARASFAIAFGSCSFREPIDDLHRLGLL